jgi:hypothetical protein
MVNVPLTPMQGPAAKRVAEQIAELQRVAGALVLALLAILALGGLFKDLPADFGGKALHDLVPLEDVVAASSFTA